VRGINHANDFNETDRNIIQADSGSIVTYPAGTVALDQGYGAVVEPVGVNILTNSSDADGYYKTNAGVADLPIITKDYGEVGTTRIQFKLNGGVTTGDYSRFYITALPAIIGLDYAMSFRAKLNSGSAAVLNCMITSNTKVENNVTVTDEWKNFEKVFTAISEGSNNGLQLRGGFNTSDEIDLLIRMNDTDKNEGLQVEQSSYATSFVYTDGAPSQRDPSQLKVSNFIESERWVDDGSGGVPCVLSDREGSGFIDGISATQFGFGTAGTGVVQGKYLGLCTVDWIGAIATGSNGVIVEYTGVPFPSVLNYIVIKNTTGLSDLDAVRQGFGNDGTSSNPFTIDFRPSAYFNSSSTLAADTLVVDALRTSAGDDVSGMPAAAMTQANNIEYVLDFVYGAFNTDAVKSICLLEQADAMNYIGIGNDSVSNNTIWVERSIAGAVDDIDVMFSTDLVEGDEITARLTVTPSLVTLSVTNNTTQEIQTSTNNTALLGDVIHPDSVLLGDTGGGVARAFVHTNARLQILDVS